MTSTATALYLSLDIETAPTNDVDAVEAIARRHLVAPLDLSGITAAANLTDPAKIEADLEKRRAKAIADHDASYAKAEAAFEEEFRKTCLDATTDHIACISAALGDEPVSNLVGFVSSHIERAV